MNSTIDRVEGGAMVRSFAQADVVLSIARLFAGSPPAIGGAPSPAAWAALAAATGAPPAVGLREALIAAFEGDVDPVHWREERTRLFEAGVVCPINETGYVRRDKGAIIADICGFYRVFGLEPSERSGEKADHLVCELELVGAMLVMLGNAERAGDAERIEIVEGAVRAFLSDHLGEWIALFCHRLVATTRLAAFAAAGEALRSAWDLLAARFGLPALASLDEEDPTPPGDGGTPYECGMVDQDCPLQAIAERARSDDGAAE